MEHLEDLRLRVEGLPRGPGVYLWKDAHGEVLYVGKAADLRARTRQYIQEPSVKGGRLMGDARDLEFIAVRNEKEALVLEQTLIKRHRPRYNVRLTDDKQYPYLWLTPGPYPRLVKVHGRPSKKGTWFGPFPDGYGAFHVLRTLNDLLPLRRCKTLPDTKCLYYDIGKCIAPCIEACTDEEYDALVQRAKDLLQGRAKDVSKDLQRRIGEAAAAHRFEEAARLRDQLQGIQGVLERQHMVAAQLEDRDIASLAAREDRGVVAILHQRDGKVVGQSAFTVSGVAGQADPLGDFLRGYYTERPVPRNVTLDTEDAAVATDLERDLRGLSGHAVRVEAPRRGDKVRWLEVARTNARLRLEQESLQKARRGEGAVAVLQGHLGLPDPPRVIEGFDVSHHAGAHTRAAMVRFVDGEPDKSGYRTFGMRDVGETAARAGRSAKGAGREVDDYASIAEAVGRRYRRLVEEGTPLPDLVVIDGGKGQLQAARAALAETGAAVPLCSLAKQDEEVFLPGRARPLRLPRGDAGLQLLQRVRDEAHRFGITQVRRRSTRSVTESALDDVPGIGPKRRQMLVQAFAGLEGLRQASVEDLTAVRGITYDMARQINEALRAHEGS